ncbi:hypothetical protein K458DRAFT_482127 [Lentithecium fluviatile CBS 122367]|uniref:DUF7514 domain-containing protein n=1 Tax=Lentithecium fluviatile CBS 122367 TaxID=1168545 RepID=A0A6G1ICW8_9PLEO|nr:hypothetical protein K458DRAFT_482127 [Lentithecium fluviatile CBS 122367]
MASDDTDTKAQEAAGVDAAHREACEYWGYLIKPDKCGTELFDRLLKGIAEVISTEFEPSDSSDLTPSQIAAFYRAVGGNYDVLFIETPPSSISFIYRSLGAFHSLQPGADDDGYSSPSIPALKKKGFVTWQTIQLLLGPEEHVGFLQNAVKQFDVKDPQTGGIFPKVLPKECLPNRPDDAMETWYQGVADRLRKEAETDMMSDKENIPRGRVHVEDHLPRTSSEMSEGEADERNAAAKYFSDPLYRKARPRPPIIRHFSRERPYEHERVGDRNKLISSVRHMLNPFNSRRKSLPAGRYEDDGYSDEDATPLAAGPPTGPRYASHKRPHPPRRETTLSSTDSDSDSDRPPSRRRTPVLRHRRSHEPATSPREYFPPYYDEHHERRYSQDLHPPGPGRKEDGPPPLYGPTKSPLFATHVANANLQAHKYYDRPRPSMPAPRTSYRPHTVRYTAPHPEVDPPYVRERDREYEPSSGGSRHRRRSEEYPRERDHERDRDRSDKARDAAPRPHRYVPAAAGVQGGVGGRRYPVVEQAWR